MLLKSIMFTFENCDQITVDGKYIGEFFVSDIRTSIERIACNSIEKITRANIISMEIHKDANQIRYPFDQKSGETENVFDRFKKWSDITSISFDLVEDAFEDRPAEHFEFRTNWVGSDDTCNQAQTTYISELGNLYLVIAKGQGIEDFFDYNYINNEDCVEYHFESCHVGDRFSLGWRL